MARYDGDKREIDAAVLRATAAAHPGTLEREDLDAEPEIAGADGRTVEGRIRRLVVLGCITPVDRSIGRVERLRATEPVAAAVKAVGR